MLNSCVACLHALFLGISHSHAVLDLSEVTVKFVYPNSCTFQTASLWRRSVDSWRRSKNRANLFSCSLWLCSSVSPPLFRSQQELCLSCRVTRNPFSDQTFTPFMTLQTMVFFNSVMGWLKRLRWGSFFSLSLSLTLNWRNFWVILFIWNWN